MRKGGDPEIFAVILTTTKAWTLDPHIVLYLRSIDDGIRLSVGGASVQTLVDRTDTTLPSLHPRQLLRYCWAIGPKEPCF